MDVIDEAWTADYDLDMIFEYFLPQLLKEPNPSSPANSGAAQILNDRYLDGAIKKLWRFETTFFVDIYKNLFHLILFAYTFTVLDRRLKFYGRSRRFKTYGYGGQSLRPFLLP